VNSQLIITVETSVSTVCSTVPVYRFKQEEMLAKATENRNYVCTGKKLREFGYNLTSTNYSVFLQ
jgi:hypothetical protein